MWLRDSLATYHRGARVLLYGCDSSLVQSESFQDIDDIANMLAFAIKQIRAPQMVIEGIHASPATLLTGSRVRLTLSRGRLCLSLTASAA